MLLLMVTACGAVHFELDRASQERIQTGKEQLERIIGEAPTQGCWATAVDELKAGCRSLDDDRRSRLAVKVSARPWPRRAR